MITFDEGFTSEMIQCVCGDVFQASGTSTSVKKKRTKWREIHGNCTEQKREGRKVFWLSFCDSERPTGQQFLGVAIIEVTAAEADDAAVEVMLRFPFTHQPDSEWIAAAIKKAHRLGCNPGGEVATWEVPRDDPNLTHYTFGVLMDRATIERIDGDIKSASSSEAIPS